MIKKIRLLLMGIGLLCSLQLAACKSSERKNTEELSTIPPSESTTSQPTNSPTTQPQSPPTSQPTPSPVNSPMSQADYERIKPNEVGQIMVVMYHGISDNPPYHRTAEDFLKDLEYMYNNGYRLISMRDYIDSHIEVEKGFTPIVLTFDDGLSSTFTLERKEDKLVPKQGTAIGILEEFIELHPDFGRGAGLYLNREASVNFANQSEIENITFEEGILWLVEQGYDIGNHTYTHAKLNQLSEEELQKELGEIGVMIDRIIPGYQMDSLTYPFGIRPSAQLLNKIEDGQYQDYSYHHEIALKEGVSTTMVAPISTRFSPYNCPRVRGSEGEESDLWWWFQYYENHPEYRYISDGDSKTIVVKKTQEEEVNQDKLGDKILIAY